MDNSQEAEMPMAGEMDQPGNSRQPTEQSENIRVDDDGFYADLNAHSDLMMDFVDQLNLLRNQYDDSPYMSELNPRLSYKQTQVYLKAAKTGDDIARATRNMNSSIGGSELSKLRKFILLGRLSLLQIEIQSSVNEITEEVARCKEVDELLSGTTFKDQLTIMVTENFKASNMGRVAKVEMGIKPHLTTFLYPPLLDLLEADQRCLEALEDVVEKNGENVQDISQDAMIIETAVKFKKSLWILMVATRTFEQRVIHAIPNH